MNQAKRWPHRPFRNRCVASILLSFLLVVLLLPAAALAQSRGLRPALPEAASATLREGVLVSPRHGLAYVMRPGGGIDAVALASGKLRWRSDRAAKPLTLAGDVLVAQAEGRGDVLDLVVLDARDGAARDGVRLNLPAGIAGTVVDSAAGSFRVHADASASRLTVRWEAATSPAAAAQGYLPAVNEAEAPGAAQAVVAGEAVVDLGSAKARVVAEPAVRAGGPAALSRPGLEELRAAAASEGRRFLSADGRHLLVSEAMGGNAGGLDPGAYRYNWTIYERATGARLGRVPAMVSATPFLVVGRTLYHTTPMRVLVEENKLVERPAALRAVNLASGKETWTSSVRETSFRGPFPP